MTTTRQLRRTLLIVTFGLGACTPSAGDSSSPGTTNGTGGVSAERTGGAPGASGGGATVPSGGNGTGGSGAGNPGSGGGSGAGSGGATSGSGGASAKGGTSGSGASTGGSSGGADAASGGTSDMATTTPPASGGLWDSCGGTSFKPGVSPMDYCNKYQEACMFGGDAKSRYASMADCIAKYSALSEGPLGGKACVAWHLCIAATPGTKDVFCPHGPEASAMSGPCKAAYLY